MKHVIEHKTNSPEWTETIIPLIPCAIPIIFAPISFTAHQLIPGKWYATCFCKALVIDALSYRRRPWEAIPEMIEKRDQELEVSTQDARKQREELRKLSNPQYGVDALNGEFDRPTQEIPGVVDSE